MSTEAIMVDDPRPLYDRMSRRELWRALKNAGINFTPGITSGDAIKLLEANQIHPSAAIEWEQVPIQNEKGETIYQAHPKRVQPSYSEADLLKREEVMQKNIEEAAAREEESNKKAKSLESQVKDLAKQNAELMEAMKELVGKKPAKKEKETDPRKMKYMAFKKWCKDHGHDLQKGEDREELIDKLEAE